VLLPPFLLVDDSYTDVESHIALLKRIGLVNAVRVIGDLAGAQRYLQECAGERLPAIVFIGSQIRGGRGLNLVRWMRGQHAAIAAIPAVGLWQADDPAGPGYDGDDAAALGLAMVDVPIDMHRLIATLKGLGLTERVRIDSATLMVQVELWPRTDTGTTHRGATPAGEAE
jgi:hypothetical protein